MWHEALQAAICAQLAFVCWVLLGQRGSCGQPNVRCGPPDFFLWTAVGCSHEQTVQKGWSHEGDGCTG